MKNKIKQLKNAWEIEGISPEYHQQQKDLLRTNWPSLYIAIVNLTKTKKL